MDQRHKTAIKQNFLHKKHINAQSLLGSLEKVKLMLQDGKTDILCISETWLHPDIEDRFLAIQGYNLFRQDFGRGGGACIYVSQDLSVNRINLNVSKILNVEDLWLTVQRRKLPSIIVGTIYRHPHALSFSFDYISNIIKEVLMKGKPVFLFGDINDDLLKPNPKINQHSKGK